MLDRKVGFAAKERRAASPRICKRQAPQPSTVTKGRVVKAASTSSPVAAEARPMPDGSSHQPASRRARVAGDRSRRMNSQIARNMRTRRASATALRKRRYIGSQAIEAVYKAPVGSVR